MNSHKELDTHRTIIAYKSLDNIIITIRLFSKIGSEQENDGVPTPGRERVTPSEGV